MKHNFFPTIITEFEALDWRARANSVLGDLFKHKKSGKGIDEGGIGDIIAAHVPGNQFESWKQFFEEQKDGFVKELEHVIKDLEGYRLCEIVVACSLSRVAYERLVNWFKGQGFERIILRVRVDERIGGGAIIAFDGKIYDFSLAKKIKIESL